MSHMTVNVNIWSDSVTSQPYKFVISPAATRSGYWWLLSRRWSCPACPDERNAGARWMTRSPRCGKCWKLSSACHRSAVTWYLAARSNLSCSNTLWSETTERGRGRDRKWQRDGWEACQHKRHKPHQRWASFMQVSGKMLCVCEAHAGESRRCVKRVVIDSLRDRWNSEWNIDICTISVIRNKTFM